MDILSKEEWNEHKACAKSGDSNAQWLVGYYYHYGAEDNAGKRLVKPDALRARQWYERAAEQGCATAQNALATLLTDGDAFPVDYATAIHWYKQAIGQGDASAAYNLGLTYRDLGKPALAYRWYAKAAAMGDKESYVQIGLCNLFGFGLKQDLQEAQKCFTKVIESTSYSRIWCTA
jgi:TPR repeat protein